MLRKIAVIILSVTFAGSTSVSCTEDIPECPGKMCIVAGGWKLLDAFADDVKENGDISQYSLTLHMPEPQTAIIADFERTHISGNQDAGTWSLENNGTILRLMPDNDPRFTEDWIVESFSPRKLVLVINRDVSFKQGPARIRFILEPF